MKKRRSVAVRGSSRKSSRRAPLLLEQVEDRVLLTQFVVSDLSDDPTDTGSLRYAITQSNATTTNLPNSIVFSGLTGSGPFTLLPNMNSDGNGPLPVITAAVNIDATTVPGFNTATSVPMVELNGSAMGTSGVGFQIAATGVTIRGFDIDRMPTEAISIQQSANQAVIAGNYIGTDITGTKNGNNDSGTGILVASIDNVIGGTTPADRNVISSVGYGVDLISGSSNNMIEGNYIGVDASGTVAVPGNVQLSPLTSAGVELVGSPFNTIGGTANGAGNVISGFDYGIEVTNDSSFTKIYGNDIGTDYTGLMKIGSKFDGVFVSASPFVTIGGTTSNATQNAGRTNVISGNTRYGIFITGGNTGGDSIIQSNLIGVGSDGTTPLGNGSYGIYLQGIANTTIGGSLPGAGSQTTVALEKQLGNTIANNGKATPNNGAGIEIQGNVNLDAILSNSIYANAGPGIQFNGGVNQFVTPPTLNSVASGGGETQVNFSLSEPRPNTQYLVQIFSSPNQPTIGFEQGKTFIGEELVTTDDNGNATNQIVTLLVPTGIGEFVTATATQQPLQLPNSSIFSRAQMVAQATVADLSVAVAPPTGSPLVGQPYTYTIVVADNGPNDAAGVTLSDTLPTNATYVSSSIGSVTNGVFNANIGTLSGAPVLTAVSIPGKTQPVAGQDYTYSVKVTNSGTGDVTNVVLSDLIPANTTFVSSSVGTFKAGSVVAPLGFLAPGASSTVTITIKPNASGPVTDTPTVTASGAVSVVLTVKPTSATATFVNVATVTSTVLQDIDPDLTNNRASTDTGPVNPDAILSLSLVPSTNPTPIGQPQGFVLTVINKGPSTVSQATITVTLPSNYSNITVVPDQGTYTVSGSTITINTGILPSSGTSTINLSGTPNVVGNFNVTATVTSKTTNPDPTQGTVTVPVTVENSADLGLTLTSSPNPVLLGQILDYTATVTNNGPSTSSDAVITDTLPNGLTFDAADSSDSGGGTFSFANGVVTVTLNPITGNGTDVATIATMPTISGPIVNSVSVADANVIDPDLTNNSASTTTLVSPADISVTLVNPTDPIFIGTQATYQVLVENIGPADAANVILIDDLGPFATIVSSSVGSVASTANGTELTANLGTITAGSTVTVTFTINPTQSGILANTATASSPQYDPNGNNNTQSVTNLVSPADLGVTVVGSPTSVLVGTQASYVVTVTNNGPAAATNVKIADTLPAGTTFVSAVTSQGSVAANGASIAGNLGTLAPGASATVTILVTTSTVATATDSASVSSDNLDTNAANNTASGSVSVINLAGTIEVGSPVTYVGENAGVVTLTLVRVGGTLGTVTADYQTNNFTAVSGVNYTATTGTVTFADGQTTATISIPVLDDFKVDGNAGFFVFLTNPTGGASLDNNNVAAVIVYNTDRDVVPPAVTGFTAIPNASSPSLFNGFLITFDKELDPARANLVSNYQVTEIDPKTGAQTPVTLAAAVFDPTTDDVALIPNRVLPANRFYHVIVNGSYGNALTDLSGNVLFGSSGLNTNYDVFFGHGSNFTYNDSMGNVVNIAISGGGSLDIFRAANGDAASVNLVNIVPHKTSLTGSVKKLSKKASGHTTIGQILGLGQFGFVKSALTTPQFYVGSAPVTIASVGTTVSAASVTIGKTSPKGPKSR